MPQRRGQVLEVHWDDRGISPKSGEAGDAVYVISEAVRRGADGPEEEQRGVGRCR